MGECFLLGEAWVSQLDIRTQSYVVQIEFVIYNSF